MIQGIPTVGVRLSAMLIDHLVMTFISAFGAVLIFGPCALSVHRLKPLAATFKSLATQQIQPWVHTHMVVWTHESRAFPNMIPWK